MQVIIERIHPDAKIPTRGSADAACFDIYSVHNTWVTPSEVSLVSTGVRFKIPSGYMIHIVPRSGLAYNGVTVLGGIIDSDYRGEIKVMLSIHGENSIKIKKGSRIAQLQLLPVPQWEFVEGNVQDDTGRGQDGFGSTGR